MFNMTNSAGLIGAKLTFTFTTPASWSAGDVVVASHATMYASAAVAPANAPWPNSPAMNVVTSRLSEDHSAGPLGSNTAHRRLCCNDCSMKSANRRTETYLKGELPRSLPARVRAPHTTEPYNGNVRRQLMPIWFSAPVDVSPKVSATPSTPRSDAFVPAGAF